MAFFESGIRFEERPFDVLHPTPELIQANPLARVPALILSSGRVIVDSNQILELFYRTHPESPLMPKQDDELFEAKAWSGLAVGLAERTVEYYLETLRPADKRDGEILEEFKPMQEAFLKRLDAALGPAGAERGTLLRSGLSQVDLDIASALGYLSLRYRKDWSQAYPNVGRYFAQLEERPAVQRTRPPAA